MGLEHLIVPENMKMLQETNNNTHYNGGMSKENRSQLKELPAVKAGTS
jgi:hypothetical protein